LYVVSQSLRQRRWKSSSKEGGDRPFSSKIIIMREKGQTESSVQGAKKVGMIEGRGGANLETGATRGGVVRKL